MHAGFGGRPFEVGFEGFGQQLAAEARALCQHRVLQGVRAVRPLFVHIFASAMRQSTRSGPTAQRAARAAAVAKRTPVASPPPAATATVAGGNANAPGGGVGTHPCTTALREHVAPSFYMHIISYAYHFARTIRAGQG